MNRRFLKLALAACIVFTGAAGLSAQQRIVIQETGQGQPLVLLPALGCRGEVWNPVAEELKRTHHSIMISIPGFGGVPGQQADFSEVTSAIVDLVKARKLHNVILAGHSFGGFLALSLAAKNPDLFS